MNGKATKTPKNKKITLLSKIDYIMYKVQIECLFKGVVANPARGQLDRENEFSLCARSRLGI